jgi:hypothetical protein
MSNLDSATPIQSVLKVVASECIVTSEELELKDQSLGKLLNEEEEKSTTQECERK